MFNLVRTSWRHLQLPEEVVKRGIKHGHLPGDISKGAKILMLEKGITVFGKPAKGVKQYRKRILMKERAVLKQRTHRLLDAWNDSFSDL